MEESNDKIIYSIIIPHYNLFDNLRRLLNSIPKRSDTEVIVVDDCSPNAKDFIEKFKREYPLVSFYSTVNNGGGGKARNIGITKAVGKYLIFADADDFFLPSFTSILDEYSNQSFDMVIFNAISLKQGNFNISNRNHHLTSHIIESLKNKDMNFLYFRFLFGEPWCRIINKKLIEKHSIKFDETRIHNDTYFAYQIGFYSTNLIIDPTVAYCIMDRKGSVSKKLDEEKNNTVISIFSRKNKFLRKHDINVFDPMILYPFRNSLKTLDLKRIRKYLKLLKDNGYPIWRLLMDTTKYKMNLFNR